jgi:phosphate transport system substrate-binding protein
MINVRRVAGSARARTVCGALLFAMAGLANAASTLVGGGTTLPAIAYVGTNAVQHLQVWGTSSNNPADGIAPNSLFGVYSAETGNPNVSYCQSGDANGKNVLAGGVVGGVAYNVQNVCPNNAAGNAAGFGAGLSGVNRQDLTQPDFVAADSPLNAGDYSNYVNNHPAGGYPTQFPAVASAIAIAFNLVDGEGKQITSSQVNFTDVQLCEIFSGEVTMWSDPRLTSAFTLPAGDWIPPNPINIQYHAEGSGATFGLSNHLANVCGIVEGTTFETSQVFASMVANFLPVLPPNWKGFGGDPAVANAIGSTPDSIGYLEMVNALAVNPALQMAHINGMSPVANFGSSLMVTPNDIVYNTVISAANNANGTVALLPIPNPPATQCMALIPPADYAVPSSTRGSLLPPGTYPIVAVSYLLGNTTGNRQDLAATQALLTAPYNALIKSQVTTIGPGTGFAFLNLASGAFTPAQVAACLVN